MPSPAPKTVLPPQSSGCFAAAGQVSFASVFPPPPLTPVVAPHPSDPPGEQIYFQRLALSLPGGQQEVEGALPVHSRLVRHPLLRQQSGEGERERTHARPARPGFRFNVFNAFSLLLLSKCQAHDKHHQPKASINCAGYKVLTSVDSYLELINNSLPGREVGLWGKGNAVFCWDGATDDTE